MIYSIYTYIGDNNFTNSFSISSGVLSRFDYCQIPVSTQSVLEIYWLGGRIHPDGKDFLADQYILSPGKVMTKVAT